MGKRKKKYKKRNPMAAILPIFGHRIVPKLSRKELREKERNKDERA